jgi:hypothetical protein
MSESGRSLIILTFERFRRVLRCNFIVFSIAHRWSVVCDDRLLEGHAAHDRTGIPTVLRGCDAGDGDTTPYPMATWVGPKGIFVGAKSRLWCG